LWEVHPDILIEHSYHGCERRLGEIFDHVVGCTVNAVLKTGSKMT